MHRSKDLCIVIAALFLCCMDVGVFYCWGVAAGLLTVWMLEVCEKTDCLHVPSATVKAA